jgi:hypothetical protein
MAERSAPASRNGIESSRGFPARKSPIFCKVILRWRVDFDNPTRLPACLVKLNAGRLLVRKREVETTLRAAGRVAREAEFFLIGSQAVHAYCRRPPAEVLLSQECDLYPKNRDGSPPHPHVSRRARSADASLALASGARRIASEFRLLAVTSIETESARPRKPGIPAPESGRGSRSARTSVPAPGRPPA